MVSNQKTEEFFSSVLPKKLLKTLQDYNDFTANPAPGDIKSFGAYHLACKNALSHIVLLMRILQTKQSESDQISQDWLSKAKSAITDDEDENMCGDIDAICMDME